MKKVLIILVALSVLILSSVTVSARHHEGRDKHHHGHHWHRYHDDSHWRYGRHNDGPLPFAWYEHYDFLRGRHYVERIDDYEWERRFPGCHPHRWHSKHGFWHHGRYVTDAVLFFNEDNRLVSIGYLADGVFIHVREDNECYENRDSFFLGLGWWRR